MSVFGWMTPARRRGVEILDDPATPDSIRLRAMADVARSNALFGGTASVIRAIRGAVPQLPRAAVLLDVGTGLAEVPERVRHELRRAGISSIAIGVDLSAPLARSARRRLEGAAVGDARCLPVRGAAADVVTCSQLLHHFETAAARDVIAELHRASRGWVVISDLRRSWIAASAFWMASILLRFDAVTRRDGVTSVLRGFTMPELEHLVRDVTGVRPAMQRGAFWRVSATWRVQPAPDLVTPV